MKNAKQLREDIGEILAKCEALNEICASEGRDLSAEEQVQFDGWLAEVGNDGANGEAKTGIHAQIERAEKFENLVSKKAASPVEQPKAKADIRFPKAFGKLKAFNSEKEAYECGLWFQANMLGNVQAKQRLSDIGSIYAAQTEGTNSAGGYTVPDIWSSSIINVMESAGVAPKVVRRIPMTSDVLNVPKRVSGQTVYYPGEASAITASDKVYGTVALSAVKRAVLTQISNELIADSLINVVDDVASEAGHQLALNLDDEFINGDGTGTYGSITGLVDDCGAAGTHDLAATNTSFADITLADIHTAMSLVAEKYWDDSRMAFIMRRSTWASVIQKLVYAAGGNTVDNLEGGNRLSLFGYPVHLTDKMPVDAVSTFGLFFGNFYEAALMGQRKEVEFASSQDYGFNLDVLTIRALNRYDLNVHANPGAGTAYGAYAGVKTAAA